MHFPWAKLSHPSQMVVIVDPHLKRASDYPVYQNASELGVLVKPKSGEGEYEGWCWPGSSSWIDFFNPTSWNFWKGLFRTTKQENEWTWTQSTDSVHIWNDMNEVPHSQALSVHRY
jgi:alpha 1,3-glucosidase